MAGRFDQSQATKLLAACHRHCCVCHRFCGSKIELDHMMPKAEGGTDDIGNAIPLCFDCHAEVHSYNDKHPRGRKFQPEELKIHKEQWLSICASQPTALGGATGRGAAGPLEAMLDEMEFNLAVADTDDLKIGCPLLDEQFRRAIASGSITLLDQPIRDAVLAAYVAIGHANQHIQTAVRQVFLSNEWGDATKRAKDILPSIVGRVRTAQHVLRSYLTGSDSDKNIAIAEPLIADRELAFNEWLETSRELLKSGKGNSIVIDGHNEDFARIAIARGALVRDPMGGVTLPYLVTENNHP